MLKTNKEKVAKPIKPLMIIGVLGAYLKKPKLFFFSTILTFPKFKKTIKLDLPKEFINSSGLMAWLYIRLGRKIGKKKAFEIVRATILSTGLAVQQANFKNVEEERSFSNLIKYQKLTNSEGDTKLNEMEVIEESDDKYSFKIKSCMFYDFFTHVGVGELTEIMCSIDNAIFNSYLPEKLIFHRDGLNNRIVDGNSECIFIIEKK